MAKKRIIILGAGLTGLSAAWHLQRKGIECRVYEKDPEVGGLCRSKNINSFIFDYDGHLLHFKHREVFAFVKNLLGTNLAAHKRQAQVYAFSKFIPYPFQANLRYLPLPVFKECLLGAIQAQNSSHRGEGENLSFSDWANRVFGQGIAKHFMLPYNRKFWGVPLEALTCQWVDGFIPLPSFEQAVSAAIAESREEFGYNARFWYPRKGGINQLVLALSKGIRHLHTNSAVREIDLGKKEIKTGSGEKEKFDLLISTLPLPELPRLIKDIPEKERSLFGKLKWNSIYNLNLGVEGKMDCGRHWLYFPEKEFCFFRAGFPGNFSRDLIPKNKSSIYAEVAYSKGRPINKSGIARRIKEDLRKAGILSGNQKICAEDVNDIKYGYPIYDFNYAAARQGILKFLRGKNIISCGRYGSWRYMSMDGCLLEGRNIAGALQAYVK